MIDKKLRIKEGMLLLTINAPADFSNHFSATNITITAKGKQCDQIHWFVQNQTVLKKDIDKVLELLNSDNICWCYYPKGTSKIKTDLTRDKGWELLLENNIHWLSLISFNDTWSAFAFRLQTQSDKAKSTTSKPREILQYIDAEKKQIFLPADLKNILSKHTNEFKFFESLSFTNKKEYVEWVVTAKKEDTRNIRLNETIVRLKKGWKNPSNR